MSYSYDNDEDYQSYSQYGSQYGEVVDPRLSDDEEAPGSPDSLDSPAPSHPPLTNGQLTNGRLPDEQLPNLSLASETRASEPPEDEPLASESHFSDPQSAQSVSIQTLPASTLPIRQQSQPNGHTPKIPHVQGTLMHSNHASSEEMDDSEPATPREFGTFDMAQSVVLSKVPRYAKLEVGEPQKITDGSSSYVSYLVTSQMYDDEKPDRVRRRFSEFSKLYENLCSEFPACAVPPLPDRWRLEYIAGDRFSSEFTTKRSASLERFLFRISQHPELRRSKYFRLFLSVGGAVTTSSASSVNGAASNNTKKNVDCYSYATNKEGESATMVALDHISDALMNAFAKARHQSKEMIDARERADRYEQNITTIDKAVLRTSKMQAELANDFQEMHRHATKLAQLEPKSGAEFETLAATAKELSSAAAYLRLGVDSHFACALRDMSHYVQALKGMLKQREQRQIDYEALVEYQKRTEHELVAAEHGQPAPTFSSSFLRTKMNELRGVDKEQMRQQRISKLKTKIYEFKQESAKAKEISDAYEELAKREVRVFDQTEAIELQQSLTGLSDSYIEYYSTVLRECRELEAKLDL